MKSPIPQKKKLSGVKNGKATPKMTPKAPRKKAKTPTKVGSTQKGKVFTAAGTTEKSKMLGEKGMEHVRKAMSGKAKA